MKRRKCQKTDYGQRLKLLKSRKIRLVVRRRHNNIHIQFVKYEFNGDKTLVEEISKNIRKHGWKGHTSNLPAAYLAGMLAGKKALQKGVKECILDTGLHAVNSSTLYATAKGVADSGVHVPLGIEIDKNRLNGGHIAQYAKVLKKDSEKYKRQFSACIRAGLDPENMPQHFEEVKSSISKGFPEKRKVEA